MVTPISVFARADNLVQMAPINGGAEALEEWFEKAENLTTVTMWRWSPDWLLATPLYEKAATGFRLTKQHERAMVAFEKASLGQARQSGTWQAAKHLESAAAAAKDLRRWSEVAAYERRAAELLVGCGRPQAAAEVLARGAKILEEVDGMEAAKLYEEACGLLEDDDGADYTAGDTFRAAIGLAVRQQRYTDAAALYMRWAAAARKANAVETQSKAYTCAVLLHLFVGDVDGAQRCFDECCSAEAFTHSAMCSWTEEVLRAYEGGDADEVRAAVQGGSANLQQLDYLVVRLAKQLPVGGQEGLARRAGEDGVSDLC